MRYCPYCGASILDDAAFCMECGASIPVSGIPKDGPKQRAPQTKKKAKKPKPIPRQQDVAPPDLPDAGYDGYYDDTPTLDEGAFKEKLDKGLIKQIILVGSFGCHYRGAGNRADETSMRCDMDKKRILLLGAMGILLAAAIALGAVWIMEAAEYAGYKADYVDIAEDVLHSDEDDGMIELVPLSPAPKQNDTLDDPTAPAATDPPIYSRAFQACIRLQRGR